MGGGGVKEIYFGLKKYLPKQPNIVKCIDLMLVQRSLIALNNSARVRNKKIFKHEIYQILKDDTLRRVANQISFGEGVRLFGAYYILLRLRMYKCIYFRYFFKYIRSV